MLQYVQHHASSVIQHAANCNMLYGMSMEDWLAVVLPVLNLHVFAPSDSGHRLLCFMPAARLRDEVAGYA